MKDFPRKLNQRKEETKMKPMSPRMPSSDQYPLRFFSTRGIEMKLISREELKRKLDERENFKLAFVLGDWQYRAMHIPGSLNLYRPQDALKALDRDDEIVVYCSNEACPASIAAYYFLVDHGYKNVRRYAGGLVDWDNAGYPLEGEKVYA
jgi:rhodanese-related sulfurtransferase